VPRRHDNQEQSADERREQQRLRQHELRLLAFLAACGM
jgi:hypothetical protein